MFIAPNPPMGAVITYWLRKYTDEEVKINIAAAASENSGGGGGDEGGHVVRTLTGTSHPGFNRVVWDLLPEKDQRPGNPDDVPAFVPPGEHDVPDPVGHPQNRNEPIMKPLDRIPASACPKLSEVTQVPTNLCIGQPELLRQPS